MKIKINNFLIYDFVFILYSYTMAKKQLDLNVNKWFL